MRSQQQKKCARMSFRPGCRRGHVQNLLLKTLERRKVLVGVEVPGLPEMLGAPDFVPAQWRVGNMGQDGKRMLFEEREEGLVGRRVQRHLHDPASRRLAFEHLDPVRAHVEKPLGLGGEIRLASGRQVGVVQAAENVDVLGPKGLQQQPDEDLSRVVTRVEAIRHADDTDGLNPRDAAEVLQAFPRRVRGPGCPRGCESDSRSGRTSAQSSPMVWPRLGALHQR